MEKVAYQMIQLEIWKKCCKSLGSLMMRWDSIEKYFDDRQIDESNEAVPVGWV